MKLLGLGDNVMDAYLFRGELYPAATRPMWLRWPGAPAPRAAGIWGCWPTTQPVSTSAVPWSRKGWTSPACAPRWEPPPATPSPWGPAATGSLPGNNGGETVQKCFAPVLTPADRLMPPASTWCTPASTAVWTAPWRGWPGTATCPWTSPATASPTTTWRAWRRCCGSPSSPAAAGRRLSPEFAAFAASCGIDEVIFTLGPRGSFGISRGKLWQAGACPVTAVDTLGAGDAYIAAFLAEFFSNGGGCASLRRPGRPLRSGSAACTMAPSAIPCP
jgi:hypothetical protein